jgi:hypothetical protein
MSNLLLEKWNPILESHKAAPITDLYRRKVTAQLLENQEKFLAESGATSTAGSIDNWDPILISLVRRMAPKLIAYDVCGVQPMTGPTGLIFALRARYGKQFESGVYPGASRSSNPADARGARNYHQFESDEALFNEANSAWSGDGTHVGSDPFTPAGTISSIVLTNGGGSDYLTAPTVTIGAPSGSGTQATGVAVLGSGATATKVIAVVLTNSGAGYTTAPAVTISAPAGTTSPVTATATAALGGTYGAGSGMNFENGERDVWSDMSMTIEKVAVTAKTRQLRADYSLELAQDLRAVHGLDAENELSNILSSEIIAEINREVIRTIYNVAKQGGQFSSNKGTFDLQYDSDGRWSVERFKGLLFAIERDANAIAYDTRRGKGNILITSADVASALVMAGVLDYNPDMAAQTNVDVDVTGATFSGTMGRFKVFVDPYLSVDGYVVGYKGTNAYDSGIFYSPYVPLQLVRATNTDTFTPAIGFKTRYAISSNPFTTMGTDSNAYYRKTKVLSLL